MWLTSKTTVTIVSGMSVTCHNSHQLVVGNNIIESNFVHCFRPAFHFYSYSDACCSNYYRQSNGNYKFAQLVMHRIKLSVEIWSKGKPCISLLTAIKRLPRCWKDTHRHWRSLDKSENNKGNATHRLRWYTRWSVFVCSAGVVSVYTPVYPFSFQMKNGKSNMNRFETNNKKLRHFSFCIFHLKWKMDIPVCTRTLHQHWWML